MRFLLPTIVHRDAVPTEAQVRDLIRSDPKFGAVGEDSAIATLFNGDEDTDLGIPDDVADGFTARYHVTERSSFVLIHWGERAGHQEWDEPDEWCESPLTFMFEIEEERVLIDALEAAAEVATSLGLQVNAADIDSWRETLGDDDPAQELDYVPVALNDQFVRADWCERRREALDAASADHRVGAYPPERVSGLVQESHEVTSNVSALDVGPGGSWVGVAATSNDLLLGDKTIALPADGMDWHVRIIDDQRVFVFHHRDGENAMVISRAGDVLARWSIPPGISQVVVTDDFVVVGYSDEGVFSHGGELGGNGLVAFTFEGAVTLQYRRQIRDAVDIADLSAMTPIAGNRIAFSAYTGYEYVELDIATHEHVVRRTPSSVHYSTALCSDGSSAWFLSQEHRVRRFDIETGHVEECGRFPGGLVRGMTGGRFLSMGTSGYTILVPG